MNILTVPTAILYIVSPSSDICTYCKSLWIKATAKCPQCKCKCICCKCHSHKSAMSEWNALWVYLFRLTACRPLYDTMWILGGYPANIWSIGTPIHIIKGWRPQGHECNSSPWWRNVGRQGVQPRLLATSVCLFSSLPVCLFMRDISKSSSPVWSVGWLWAS